MAQLSRAVASLRVMGDDLIPGEVSSLPGAPPSMAYARRDDITGKHGSARVAKSGHWSYYAPDTEPADVDAQVAQLLGGSRPTSKSGGNSPTGSTWISSAAGSWRTRTKGWRFCLTR